MLLETVITPALGDVVPTRAVSRELKTLVLRYMFRHVSASDFGAAFTAKVQTARPREARRALMGNGALLKNVKLFAYADVIGQARPSDFQICGSTASDVRKTLAYAPNLCLALRSLHRQGYKAAALHTHDATMSRVLSDRGLSDYTGKFISKKMSFLLSTGQHHRDELRQDFYTWATYALYRAYPKIDSYLHAINIAKQAIHNRGINLIKEATTAGRQRLLTHGDGTFSAAHLSVDQVPTGEFSQNYLTQCNYLMTSIDGSSAEDLSPQAVSDLSELRISLRVYYASLPPRLKKLVKLWSCEYDETFSTLLGFDNDDAPRYMRRVEYLKAASDYVGLDRDTAKAFYKTLRTKFADYRRL